jgi:hypothetical protein
MSDLTTLATLERIVDRARGRFFEEGRWDVSGLRVLELLDEEIKAERAPKKPWTKPTLTTAQLSDSGAGNKVEPDGEMLS